MLLALMLFILQADPVITGVVKDIEGGAIPGATVVVRTESAADQRTVTGPDGRFVFTRVPEPPATLIVLAGGFAVKTQPISGPGEIEVVLAPAAVRETVTVTPIGIPERMGDTPASVSVLTADDVAQSPAVIVDDLLRRVPTFSLFRRTSSLSAHPTAQGVSLRGIGPSGVSRSLVMSDGVPVNDPFGGWVYWTRVPLESVDRIEIVDGPSSSLYGNYAIGGVINIVSAPPTRRTIEVKPQYGSRNSPKVDFFASDVWGKLGAVVEGSAFDTEGFPIVDEDERGLVDDKAAVNFRNLNLRMNYHPTSRFAVSLRTGYFHENRDNGKHSTLDGLGTKEANDTTWRFVNGTVRVELPDGSDLQASMFSNVETFHSNFLAVPDATTTRNTGRMSLNQTVPVKDLGGAVQWSRPFGTRTQFSAGTDWRWVDGDSEEEVLDSTVGTTVTLERVSGGSQRSTGLFARAIVTPASQLTVTLSARLDHWRTYDGHNLETNVPAGTAGSGHNPALPERSDTVLSPRVGALYHLTDWIDIWGDVNSGFRAPTLNELYRQFRVGTTLTTANFNLKSERLIGAEGGVTVTPLDNLTMRLTMYTNHVEDPVFNVTIGTSGTTILQQRQNIERTNISGFQADAEYRFGASWKIGGAYLHNSATVSESVVNPQLVGKHLQQAPRNRGSVHVAFTDPRLFTVGFDLQAVGAQFDDDLNTPIRLMPKFAVANITASRTISANMDVFFGVQNLFNTDYVVSTLPTTIGTPRLINGGLRIRFTGQ
jgi:outer membrane receptor protein involved in Fe transport